MFSYSIPCIVITLATSFETDLKRYSSSSIVPFLPDPTFLSSFRFDLELRLEWFSIDMKYEIRVNAKYKL